MKKVFGIGSCMMGMLLVISGAVMKLKGQTTVTVIGGADGPTSIFVAVQEYEGWFLGLVIVAAYIGILVELKNIAEKLEQAGYVLEERPV